MTWLILLAAFGLLLAGSCFFEALSCLKEIIRIEREMLALLRDSASFSVAQADTLEELATLQGRDADENV